MTGHGKSYLKSLLILSSKQKSAIQKEQCPHVKSHECRQLNQTMGYLTSSVSKIVPQRATSKFNRRLTGGLCSYQYLEQ